ncbi:MAG: T9SS type A sorting domain-containing protein [Saprospiraceae bacterium]|nr:T9SS type A sorting domain-containing protein [Saprospiraceae bacterium]
MNNKILFALALTLLTTVTSHGQWDQRKKNRGPAESAGVEIQPISMSKLTQSHTFSTRFKGKIIPRSMPGKVLTLDKAVNIRVLHRDDRGSIWVEGELEPTKARDLSRSEQRNLFMSHSLTHLGKHQPFQLQERSSNSEKGVEHFKYQQTYLGYPVYSNEVTLHVKGGHHVLLGFLQEALIPETAIHSIDQNAADQIIIHDLVARGVRIFSGEKKKDVKLLLEDDSKQLVWYKNNGKFILAWHIQYHPNLASRWEYFVDAGNGHILHQFESICKAHNHPPHYFDGKSVGTGLDLNGVQQSVQTYEIGGTHVLIDVTRADMFDPRSPIPANPVGTIITLDAVNTFPGADDFRYKDLISNSTTWNNPDGVSAHINAALAYEYLRQTFSRISINGQGGNIISLINVADEDGSDMDNAFWNGKAIFYGKGNQAFSSPLSRALDVAAHELGHGVIGTTANLEYQGESGALNESFADIFGVVVEREDWLIGEDIVNRNIFRDALRNMVDPHNGGNSLNDPGYQPAHYDERYTGKEDNGGVHINSGIPNRAFYLFANEVGLEAAEQVYYSVLTNYLTRSSRFVDLRIAAIAAAQALYTDPQVAQIAAQAFDLVGILGTQGGDYTEDVEVNPGQDFVLVTSRDDGLLRLIDPAGNSLTEGPLSQVPPYNPPSITDDGSLIVYVAEDRTMHFIEFDWQSSTYSEGTLESNTIWSNVAVAKDGSKVAGILDEVSDSVFIFSLAQNNFRIYELYNPTTADGNINTGEVIFPDALEWDHSGEFLMYDALNSLRKFGTDEALEYWDIGFIQVWDNNTDNYSDGFITKLFTGLPERLSVGNPTFAKNSPYIIAFDYIDESEETITYDILGVNIETFDIGEIYRNTVIGYPSFSSSDDRIIFNAEGDDQGNLFDVIGSIDLSQDKINSAGNASIFYRDAIWGEWFSNGDRALVNILEGDTEVGVLKLFPNPVTDVLFLEADWLEAHSVLDISVQSLDGKILFTHKRHQSSRRMQIDFNTYAPGIYFIKLKSDSVHRVFKVVKK